MKTHFITTLHLHKLLFILFTLLTFSSINGQQRYLDNHPRLLFTQAEEQGVQLLIEQNPLAKELAGFLREKADSLLTAPQIEYKLDVYGNTLGIARSYVQRLGTLSIAYRIYGEQKYADAVNKSLLWVCNFPDWCPKHYLDTAEMSTAVAVAYDWLFHVLPLSTKELVKRTLYQRALVPVLREYEKGGGGSWAKRETNWNVVCNAGMVVAALAIAEDYPQEAATILDNAAKYIPNCLKHFAPDGVCYEGPAYWGYTTTYLSIYLKAVADNDAGRGEVAQLAGLDRTALYSKRTLTPSGRIFNFGNASNDPQITPAYFFLSKYYNHPEVADWCRMELKKTMDIHQPLTQTFFLMLPWFDAAVATKVDKLPAMEFYHNSINDIVVFNGNRKKNGSIFLIAKGGEPRQAHQHLDGGSFLVESEGVCWVEDLGSDYYALPGFWDGKPNGKRWSYFRNNNFSHSTLNIDHQLQHAAGKAFVSEIKQHKKKPSATINMTTLYKDQAELVTRTFTLADDCTMEITDAVELVHPASIVSWVATTKADVQVHGNQLTLMRDGKKFYLEIMAPANATFTTYPAVTTHKDEYPIKGVTVIEAACGLTNGKGNITVRMSSKRM